MYASIGRLAILHNVRLISTLKEKDTAALVRCRKSNGFTKKQRPPRDFRVTASLEP